MATKKHRRGVGAKSAQKLLAVMLAAMLALTGCTSGGMMGDINDNETPLSATGEETVETEAAEEAVPEAAYSQTLEDGTVVSSEAMDVSDMDIEVVTVQEEAPEVEELSAEVLDPETTDGSQYSTFALEAVMGSAMGLETAAATPLATSATAGGLTVTGGVEGTDFTLKENEMVIQTSTPLTLKGTYTGTVKVKENVEAWIILDGVTITTENTSSPINLLTPSKAHIILADGSSNTLHTSQQLCAGIHCGDGSELWIDDSVVNYDFAANKHIDVLYGVVDTPGTLTNLATGATVDVVKGDVLSKINSTGTVGKLIVHGGQGSAAIGAGPGEVSGTMTFDGGYIEAYSWGGHSNNNGADSTAVGVGTTGSDGKNHNSSSGTGIGGGACGGGATQTTFNAGTIYSYGSYHGAGIGAGWSSGPSSLQVGAKAPTRNTKNCGNININGGYILSQGYAHGNAFGGACGTTLTGNTVRITGGTLRPFSKSNKMDIGGAGGYVIIDGGSVSLSGGPSSQSKNFQSADNKAYADVARTQEVVPVEVDLAAETGQVNYNITSWALYIDGKQYSYGAPSTFNAGKLCLWLPPDAKSKKVTVELNYYNEEKGSEVLVEPLYREGGSTSSNVKRNVYFDMPMEIFGDVEQETVTLPTISNFPNELLVDGKVPETVKLIKKEYDGLPFETASIENPLQVVESRSGEVRTLTSDEYITYSFRSLNGNTFSDELTSETMPSDTGLMAFAMNSTEYANYVDPVTKEKWGNSYIGHRSNGWCQITPVPAVLTLESAEWGNLNLETGDWKPTTTKDDEPGNRIKVTMNLRSAIGTMPTCKTPTGTVQLTIDGRKFGEPIVLTEEAIEADGFSTYDVTEGAKTKEENTEAAIQSAENRWTAHITYYMDPAQADGLLNAKPSKKIVAQSKSDLASAQGVAGVLSAMLDNVVRATSDGQAFADEVNEAELGENEYKLSAEYIPDKNYVEGVEANPQNADATATIIVPVDTPVDITDDQGTKYEFEEVDGGGGGGLPGSDGTDDVKTMHASVVKNYSDFHKKDAAGNETIAKDYFVLQIESSSAMPMTWTSSDPAVADVMRDEKGNVIYDENGNPKIQVKSCGAVTITMHQNGNAIYNEQTHIIDMTVIPDENLKPETEARVIWQNLTHPGMPAAPGDVVEYTVVGSNLTEGSSWQDVNLGDMVPGNVTVNKDSIEIAKNFETPENLETMTPEDLAGLTFEKATDATVSDTADGGTQVTTNVGSVYGGQSTALKFTVTVNDGIADRDTITGDNPPTIPNTPVADGSYGVKETQDLVPGVEAGSGTKKPVDDTKIIGIDADADPEALVLPKDPVIGGNDSDIYVDKTAENLTREGGITLPGDTVRYTITVGNRAADSCLYWPVIRDTLPVGVEPVPGSFVLTRVDGAQVPVADNVYVKATRTVALYVDDLYGGESTTLTFECTVGDNASAVENTAQTMGTTPSEKYKKEHPPADDPDAGDEDPDGNDPGAGDKDPDGTNPDEGDKNPDGTDPDGDGDNPGGNDPDGNDPDDPDKVTPPWPPVPGQPWTPDPGIPTEDYPWDDFDWGDYIEENGIPEVSNPEPAAPGTLIPSTDPKLFADKDGEADLVITKTAENLTNGAEGDTYVTDRVRYTITLTDTKDGTAWFNAVVRDTLPRGVEIDMATARLVTAQGAEVAVAADAYNPMTRILAVNVGDVPGGEAAVLTFEADIVDEAVGSDIGNTARAYGTLPSELDVADLEEGNRPVPGSAFNPVAGWDAFDQQNPSIVTAEAAYPSAKAATNGVRPASESPQGGDDDRWGTSLMQKYLRLAQTGDPLVVTMTGLVVVALSAAVVLVLMTRRRKKAEEDA